MNTSQAYYAECIQPGEGRGLRMAITLSEGDDYPAKIVDYPCISDRCQNDGVHDLLPMPQEQVDELMADDDADGAA